MTRSLRHRLYRRGRSPYVWWAEPIISSYAERLKQAAFGDHVCQIFTVPLKENR